MSKRKAYPPKCPKCGTDMIWKGGLLITWICYKCDIWQLGKD